MKRWIRFVKVPFSYSRLLPNKRKHERVIDFPKRIIFKFKKDTGKFAQPLLAAAEKFPELHGVHITIRRKKIGTLMAALPTPNFLFRRKENRRYVIFITDHPQMNAGPIYNSMSNKAMIGVLGHELSHILSYSTKNNLELIWFGIEYVFNRKNIEADTDIIAISKGFGNELIKYNDYIHNSPHTNSKYLKIKNKYYLTTTEIEQNTLKAI